jgi:hypothetical protein
MEKLGFGSGLTTWSDKDLRETLVANVRSASLGLRSHRKAASQRAKAIRAEMARRHLTY